MQKRILLPFAMLGAALTSCGQSTPTVAAPTPALSAQGKTTTSTSSKTVTYPAPKRTFYVDCVAGADSNSGLGSAAALKTIAKLNSVNLAAGDHVLLKSGCVFNESLIAKASGTARAPIVYRSYGEGERPQLNLTRDGEAVLATGNYLIFDGLKVSSSGASVPAGGVRCTATPAGWRIGFSIRGQNSVVQNAVATGFQAGIHLVAANNKVLSNTLTDNNVMRTNTAKVYDDDSGAWGVLVNSDNNEIAYNTFSGNHACSEDYGVDGASIELYEASRNSIHHNTTTNDITFTELGGTASKQSSYNTYQYNIYAPDQTGGMFIVLRGSQSVWGANVGTVFNNNIGYMVDAGINCSSGCDTTILTATGNTIWQRDVPTGVSENNFALWADGPIKESNNTFWKNDGKPAANILNTPLSSTDRIADPNFADPTALNFSPALIASK